jgi:hypothetical protein
MVSEEFAWAIRVSRQNKLYLLDVLEDMQAELEMKPTRPAIPLWKPVIRYAELYPIDGIQMRYNYMQKRHQVAQLLEQHGIISDVSVPTGQSGFDVVLLFQGDVLRVAALIAAVRASFPKQAVPEGLSLLWSRFATPIFAFVSGSAFTLAALQSSWRLALLGAVPMVGLLRSLALIPRWRGTWKSIVDAATVLGALAAIGLLIVELVRRG